MLDATTPHTVFVSHAHADNELCDRYVAALRTRGLDVWYDRTNMQDGHFLSQEIESQLRQRTAFIILVTPASLASYWVRLEIGAFQSLAAQDVNRLFVPVRVAQCEMPLLMMGIKWIDAMGLGFDAAVDALARALRAPDNPQSHAAEKTPPADIRPPAAGPQRGADLRYELTISFEEAVHGCQKEIEIPRWDTCPNCQGTGVQPGTNTQQCEHCQGRRRVRNLRPVTLNIPAGVDDGMNVRVTGEGEFVPHGKPGNLFVVLTVKPHEYFKRQGTDILYDLFISPTQAAQGVEVTFPTIDGVERLKIPAGTHDGRRLRIPGKGVPVVHSSERGDQFITVRVATR